MLHINVGHKLQLRLLLIITVPHQVFSILWIREKKKKKFFHKDESKKTEVEHCVLPSEHTQASGVPPSSPLSRLLLPLCRSISLHDDQRYLSHMQVSFLYGLWQGQTWHVESLMSQLKKWKHNTCLSEALKRHHKAQFPGTDVVGRLKGGCSLLCERKVEHSFKHQGVVGRNVLSFNYQSKDLFFFNWNLKMSPFFAPLYPSECTRSHNTAQGKGLSM